MSEAGPSDAPAEARRRASLLVSAGRARDAIAILERVLARAPDDPGTLCELSLACLHAGDRARQLTVANRAAAANPESEWAQRLRCDALGALGRHDEALEAARRAVALAPREPLALLCLVKALRATKDRPAARAQAADLVALAPQKASSHETWALVALDDGRLVEAEEGMRRALALEPEAATYHNNLGLVLLRQNRREEAVAAFEQAARIDPTLQVAQQNLVVGIRSHLHVGLRGFISDLVGRLIPGANQPRVTFRHQVARILVIGLVAGGFLFGMKRAPDQVAPIFLIVVFGSMMIVSRVRLRRLSPTLQRFVAARQLLSIRQALKRGARIVLPVLLFVVLGLAIIGVADPRVRSQSRDGCVLAASVAAIVVAGWRHVRRRRGDRGAG